MVTNLTSRRKANARAAQRQSLRQAKLREVGAPSNESAFLRDGARYGAMKVTSKNGTVRFFVNAQTHYYDIDTKTWRAPIFVPQSNEMRKAFREAYTAPQLD